jgi:glycosyltransferase involved in cell wall biosynthesis
MRSGVIRICVLGTSPNARGGIGTVIKEFHAGFQHPGYEYLFIVSHDDINPIAKLFKGLKAAAQLLTLCGKRKIDAVHIHSADGASFIRAKMYISIAHRFSIPVINHIHAASWDTFYLQAPKKRQREIERIYSQCDALIALSDEWRMNLSMVFPKERIYVLENFIPFIDESHVPSIGNHQIALISRIEKVKGTDILPDIISSTLTKISDAHFVICGEGSQLEMLKKTCSIKGISEKNLTFGGWVTADQRKQILSESSLYLLPSYAEGMPMSILEGIGFNIPIVTTPVGGIPQIVQDKKMVSSAIQGMHKNSPMQLSRYFPMRTSLIIWCRKIEKSQKDIQ